MHTERQRLAQNAALQTIAKFIGTGISLATFGLLLHYFNEDGFGVLTIAFTYTSVFAILVDFGLTITTAAMISEKDANEERLLGNLLSLRLITAVIFLAIPPIASFFLPASPELRLAIAASSVSFLFSTVGGMFTGVFQKRQEIWVVAAAELVNRASAFAGVLLAGSLGLGLVAASLAFTAGGLLQMCVTLAATAQRITIRPQWEHAVLRTIIVRSWPIGLSIFFNLIYLKGDILFMWLFGRSETEIGYYGSAYKVVDVMTTIPTMFMGLVLPILSAKWSANDTRGVNDKLQESFDMLSLIAVPFAVGSVLVGVPLMESIRGTLGPAGQVLMILGPAAALVYYGVLYGHAVVAVGKQRIMTLGYALAAVIGVIGYSLVVPTFGMFGAAWVTFATEALIALLTFAVVAHAVRHRPNLVLFTKILVASLVMGIGIAYIPLPHIFISITLGIGIYAVALAGLGGPSPKEILKLFVRKNGT